VKIRGFRIELREIELALKEHPAVREAVAMSRDVEPGSSHKNLVAYVIPHHRGVALTTGELRSFLKVKLPEQMIPSHLVFLDALPLTSNGKVDRQKLPAPGEICTGSKEGYVAPRTPVEEVLSEIFAETLKIDQVGVFDNFFEMGGDSLVAIRATARIRNTLRVDLPPRNLFESPTIATLAGALIKRESQPGSVETIARLRKKIARLSDDKTQALIRSKSRLSPTLVQQED
jgi:acyl carrier protein